MSCADARPSFYSHKAAPGIVMATGNTGDYLDFAADITCTWLSHDGGATWQDVLNFPGIYEFGDHGGIILMAPHQARCSYTADPAASNTAPDGHRCCAVA